MKRIIPVSLILAMTCLLDGVQIQKVQTIRVKKPEKGDTIRQRQVLRVEWSSIGLKGEVRIVLRSSESSFSKVLATRAISDSLSAHPYTDLEGLPFGFYFIRIRHIETGIKADSGIFRFAPAEVKIEPIVITSPGEGDTYYEGDIIKVDWRTTGAVTGTVDLTLVYGWYGFTKDNPPQLLIQGFYVLIRDFPVNRQPYYFACPWYGEDFRVAIRHTGTERRVVSGKFSVKKR